ncbi:hypothetical protein ACNI3Q_06520 [Sphingomonas sp. FW199]|uniref:hypothetical protein n=1 Tax=Sphingomonas sp. FW199 TaxID=3400217 RepID=UPI003CF90C10
MSQVPAATRRYLRRFMPTMATYMAALFFANWAIRQWDPQGAALVLLSVLPALPIVILLWVIGRLIVETTDEYVRQTMVTAMLGGTGLMLAVTTVWGFLEDGGVLPHLPAYWAFVLWCAGWGITQCVLALRERAGGEA